MPSEMSAVRPIERQRSRLGIAVAAVSLAAAMLVGLPAGTASGSPAAIEGTVRSGSAALAGYEVALHATNGEGPPVVLATTTTGADGRYAMTYESVADSDRVLYLTATNSASPPTVGSVALASVLGPEPIGPSHVVTPQTTVGTAYAMAQFSAGGAISGPSPGLQNAASMAHNLFDPVSGASSSVLVDRANTGTETLANFNSLSNLVAACVYDDAECTKLFASTTPDGGVAPTNTFEALDNLVHDPSHNAEQLYAQSLAVADPYTPARTVPVVAWNLVLRFDGDGETLNGPGNFAVDHEGNVWTLNNYTWNPKPEGPACSSKELIKFLPNGEFAPGSPYRGGGVSGTGFGIDIDPFGDIWTGNFGFASTNCTEYTPHDSVSQFHPDGTAVSPDATGTGPGETGGYIVGGLDWPQGTVSDADGNIWVANCEGNSVTYLPEGDPYGAVEFDDLGLRKPLDIAFDLDGNIYVTGTESDNVAFLAPDGTPLRDPLTGSFRRPMGIAANSDGEMWVSNSRLIDLPCPTKEVVNEGDPSVAFIDGDQNVTEFFGGGLFIPWGIAVDGNDNVWAANFGQKRLSGFCGVDASAACPSGAGRGTPFADDGYPFDGLVRSTGVAIDTAGNVWLTNNWKETPFPTNPGGYQVVVYVGIAGPVQPPTPVERPVKPTPPAPPSPPVPAPAIAVPGSPRYTG